MFDIFNKKTNLVAPAGGRVIDIIEVPDIVFSQKTVGDGVAIDEIVGDEVCAPANGTVELILHTNHAFAIKTKNDIELLVHIGINTVELKGKCFVRLVEEGKEVKAGDPIIKIDKAAIEEAGFSSMVLVIISNMDLVANLEKQVGKQVVAGKDKIITVKRK